MVTNISVDQGLSLVTTEIALVSLPYKGHALLISWVLAIDFAIFCYMQESISRVQICCNSVKLDKNIVIM